MGAVVAEGCGRGGTRGGRREEGKGGHRAAEDVMALAGQRARARGVGFLCRFRRRGGEGESAGRMGGEGVGPDQTGLNQTKPDQIRLNQTRPTVDDDQTENRMERKQASVSDSNLTSRLPGERDHASMPRWEEASLEPETRKPGLPDL